VNKIKQLAWRVVWAFGVWKNRARNQLTQMALAYVPTYRKRLEDELFRLSCMYANSRMPLHLRWRMGRIHYLLGTYSGPGQRFMVFSAAGYRRSLKATRKAIDEMIGRIKSGK